MSCGVEFGAGNTWFWTHVQHLFISSPSLSPPPSSSAYCISFHLWLEVETFLNMRYHKTDFSMMICPDTLVQVRPALITDADGAKHMDAFLHAFESRYKREFSYIIRDRDIIVDDVRVRATGKTVHPAAEVAAAGDEPLKPRRQHPVVFDDAVPVTTPIYNLDDMRLNDKV